MAISVAVFVCVSRDDGTADADVTTVKETAAVAREDSDEDCVGRNDSLGIKDADIVSEDDTEALETLDAINDGDDEHDNVANSGLNFPRLDVQRLVGAIMAMSNDAPPPGGGTATTRNPWPAAAWGHPDHAGSTGVAP